MSSNYHTPIAPGAPANAATFNTPMADLDQAISDIVTGALSLDSLYAAADHDHDTDYAALGHNHDSSYSALGHNHNSSYSALGHNHDERYYTEGETASFLAGKSDVGHTHPEYAGGSIPSGAMMDFGGTVAPSGWLLCYGQAISRSTYSALFAVIGTAFGSGDGSTTFNLPDGRGRTRIGLDNMGGVSANRVTAAQADVMGGNSGAETHTLSVAEMPSHAHSTPAQNGYGNAGSFGSGNAATGTRDTNYTGGGGAHNNMQPYIALNLIIKT